MKTFTQPHRSDRGALRARHGELRWGERTYVMGVVNVTPDSFSGDGIVEARAAIAHGLSQFERSSDLLDIGAQSTRPGHTPIDAQIELQRLLPVIRGVRERLPNVLISSDTFNPEVFRAAHRAGADILNSIWGLSDDLLEAVVQTGAPVIIMHNKTEPVYAGDVLDEVLAYLDHAANRAVAAGVKAEQIVLDPGIGFGKLADHNIAVLARLDRLIALGFPTLLATSRKSTLGKLTGRPVGERVHATAATVALAIAAGIDIVRVHDVSEIRDVVSVTDAIVRNWRPASWT
ncbi:MAG: dihydropteroate synthase [Candidatus Eremiobacteraeota bacterium]|nr:dihydropteroate synthase [Candidatus Eremiobacteraeota bacterium]